MFLFKIVVVHQSAVPMEGVIEPLSFVDFPPVLLVQRAHSIAAALFDISFEDKLVFIKSVE